MKKSVALLIAVPVLFLTACGNPEPQTEDISMDNPPEQPPLETEPVEEHSEESVLYYSFLEIDGSELPTGRVVVLPDILILVPTSTGMICVGDPAVNISEALRSMINDPRNEWTSDDLEISNVTFSAGHAVVELQGEIFGAGDIVLIASGMQVLMTVFTDNSVQTATVTLNGECIGNLGISHESEARPADYVYARAEIEAFSR
ncbi:hypothetical protein DRQ25_06975 [Candidatus Fermentibacteria bacterium]|nr:MAG: hypothetical protein DRQ25_06975 [Candidatus Fermentibacteria bacterium]